MFTPGRGGFSPMLPGGPERSGSAPGDGGVPGPYLPTPYFASLVSETPDILKYPLTVRVAFLFLSFRHPLCAIIFALECLLSRKT